MPALKYRTTLPRPDDPDILESIDHSQRQGYSQKVTATNAQIGDTTLVDWLQEGRLEIAALATGQLQELGSTGLFAACYLRAAADREMLLTDAITASITDKSVAFVPALISLKARNPADWLEARSLTVETTSTVTVKVELAQPSEAELLDMVQRKLKTGTYLLAEHTD